MAFSWDFVFDTNNYAKKQRKLDIAFEIKLAVMQYFEFSTSFTLDEVRIFLLDFGPFMQYRVKKFMIETTERRG